MSSSSVKIPEVHRLRTKTQSKREIAYKKCCNIFSCFNLNLNLKFITTRSGVLKLLEIVLGLCCELILYKFGSREEASESFLNFQSTVAGCITTSFLLFLLYLCSFNTYCLIRRSVFDFLYSAFSSFLYISSSSYLGFSTEISSYMKYFSFTSDKSSFPAMQCVYYIGGVLGVVYFVDAYDSLKDIRN